MATKTPLLSFRRNLLLTEMSGDTYKVSMAVYDKLNTLLQHIEKGMNQVSKRLGSVDMREEVLVLKGKVRKTEIKAAQTNLRNILKNDGLLEPEKIKVLCRFFKQDFKNR